LDSAGKITGNCYFGLSYRIGCHSYLLGFAVAEISEYYPLRG